jgi:O-antigen/teichoic acid export membrane protein
MALNGFGAYALGVACVVQAGVAMVLTYRAKPHPVKPLFRHADGGETLSTGKAVFLTNVVNWLLANLDRVIIGRVLNAHAVGIYTLAYNLASIPNTLLVGALQPAFVATGAKLQDNRERLAQGWLLAIACVLVLAMPAAVVMAMLSFDLVRLVYGVQWMESAWVLAVMFLCLPAWACWGLSTPVLWNTGRREYEYRLQLPLLAVAAPLWWYFAPEGVRAIAIVSSAVIFSRAIVILAATLRALGLRWSALARDALRGFALSALCAAAVVGAQEASSWTASPLVALFAGGIAAGVAMLAVLVFKPEALGRDAQTALSRVVPKFGPRLAPRGGTAA